MKRYDFIQSLARYASLLFLIVLASFASVRAQTVIPRVCINLTNQAGAEIEAHFGYQNLSNATINISASQVTGNFFVPGQATYPGQPGAFAPGIHENVIVTNIGLSEELVWFLDGGDARAGINAPRCATITYQGRLTDSNVAANGQYDLRFTAYDALTGGAPQSESIVIENAQVTNGVFTVSLNFGSSLSNNNNAKFLEIGVRAGTSTGAFTILTPRQPITKVPYAVNADTATNATNATNAANADKLGNVAASQYVLTTDPRLSATNNTSFIQNTTTQQAASNFNISGSGTIGGNLTINGTLNAALPAGSANYIQNTTTPQNANINISGTVTNGCRAGFTAFAGGRLCVSEMKPAAYFLVAIQTCANDSTRVGNSGDVTMTLGGSANFNYFGGLSQGWLGDNLGNNMWGTWKISFANADFAGAPANGTTAGPQLPYRCVY